MGNLRNLCHHGTDRNAQACGKCAVEKRAEELLQRRGLDAVAVTESNCLYNLVGEDNIQQLDKRAWVILFDVAKDLVEAESREQAMRECLGDFISIHGCNALVRESGTRPDGKCSLCERAEKLVKP